MLRSVSLSLSVCLSVCLSVPCPYLKNGAFRATARPAVEH